MNYNFNLKKHRVKSSFRFLLLGILIIVSTKNFAQNVGINATGATPNAAAILDLNTGNSGTQAFLPQKVALTATNVFAPVAPASNSVTAGFLVYNTNTNNNTVNPSLSVFKDNYYYWDGSKWNLFMAAPAPVVNTAPVYFSTGSYTYTSTTLTGASGTGTSTNWTVPANVYQINVFVAGGGGGGSGNGTSGSSWAGANAGVVTGVIDVTPGEVLTLYVGAGGTGWYNDNVPGHSGNGAGGTGSYIKGTRNGTANTFLCAAGGGGGSSSAGASGKGGGGSFYGTYPGPYGSPPVANLNGGTATTASCNYTAWLRNGIAFRGGDDVSQADNTGTTSLMFTASYASGVGYGLGGDGSVNGGQNGTRGIIVIQW